MEENNIQTPPRKENRTIAWVSYITFVGWIIAIIMHSNDTKKSESNSFHLRQSLGLHLSYIAVGTLMIIPFLGWLLIPVEVLIFVYSIIGMINAIKGKQEHTWLVGEFYQKLFKGIK